jgi:hypothetical protein
MKERIKQALISIVPLDSNEEGSLEIRSVELKREECKYGLNSND